MIDKKLSEAAQQESESMDRKVKYEKIRNKTLDKNNDNLKKSGDDVNTRKFKDV